MLVLDVCYSLFNHMSLNFAQMPNHLRQKLKQSRNTAPPLIKLTGSNATLIIPFMAPDEKILRKTLPKAEEVKPKEIAVEVEEAF